MGWCSATKIMDAAVAAADEAVKATLQQVYQKAAVLERDDAGKPTVHTATVLVDVDAVLSPFVAAIADKLRDGDWDCIEESDYFGRFPQEMLGHDDRRYQEYLHDKLRDTGPDEHNFADLVHELAEVTERMENTD